MNDAEFRQTVAQAVLALRESVNAQTELLRSLSRQQEEVIRLLQELCAGRDDDPYGLFDEDDDDAPPNLQP